MHGIAAHFQHKNIARASNVGQGDGFRIFQRLQRAAGGDAPDQGERSGSQSGFHGGGAGSRSRGPQRLLQAAAGRLNIERARAVGIAPQ